MRLLRQSWIWASPIISLSSAQQQYLTPAPVSAIKPDPSAYQHFLPSLIGQGDFSHLNSSVTPWQPIKVGPLAPLGQPASCYAEQPTSQSQYWLPHLPARTQGHSPFLVGGKNYQVYRNVKDFGAVGDGKHDDTDAFNRAITDQSRMAGGNGPGGTTGQPALIYVPAGTYKITSSIQLFVDTQVIGDPINPPVIKAAPVFKAGSYLVNGFDYGTGSTTNFYIGLRNVVLDTTAAKHQQTIYALNWAVSQATNLVNVEFVMPEKSQHVGIEMNGGSGGGGSGTHMANLTFSGGMIGLLFNNQQYALKNLKFRNVNTAIAISHAFIISMQGIECSSVGICVDAGSSGVTGSTTIIDSSCDDCGVVVNGTSTFLLENIAVTNSGPTLQSNGKAILTGDLVGKTYAAGHYFSKKKGQPVVTSGTHLPYTKRGSSLVDSTGQYFSKEQPTYADYPVSSFASVKDAGARGDGVHDDTAAIQNALLANANCKITYFPYGVYVVTKTLYIPPGSRIIGEVWSTVTASGDFFADASNPQPMFQVGKPGDVGVAEISDMLFTVADVLPGAIIVEVNMAGDKQGDVSFHNSHYRIGGAVDSKTETACQTAGHPCKAAFMVLHLGKTSSAYIENAWLWSADHDLDGDNNQVIGTGRGAYVEATKATWLIGIGSEHHVMYAMQFANAQNVYMSMLQVETPYWQPVPQAPSPWTPNATWNDPTFHGANASIPQNFMQWSLRIIGSKSHTLNLYGQGFWVFFNNLGDCTGPNGNCQVSIVDLEGLQKGSGIELYALNTRGVENLVTLNGSGGTAAVTSALNPGSWGAVIAAYLGFE